MAFSKIIILTLALIFAANALKINSILNRSVKRLPNVGFEAFKSASVSALLYPSFAIADEGVNSTPVLIPLVISVLTIVPFVLYQQALKPKPRTVKQIELDENLRPKDRSLSSGKTGQATAQKKK